MGLVPARRPGWLLEGRGNPSPRGMAAHPHGVCRRHAEDRTRLTGPLALCSPAKAGVQIFFVGLGSWLRRSNLTPYRSVDAEAEEIGRLGISSLARLRRQGPRRGEAAPV